MFSPVWISNGGTRTVSTRRRAEAGLVAAGELYFDRPADVVEVATMKPLRADGGSSASYRWIRAFIARRARNAAESRSF